jgi:hypothetical protein
MKAILLTDEEIRELEEDGMTRAGNLVIVVSDPDEGLGRALVPPPPGSSDE